MTILSWVVLCLRVLVAAVFIAYAASKLHNPSSFAAVIRSHRLIPDALSSAAAWTLIIVEMAVGLLFLFNVFPLLSGIAIGVLLLLFSGVLLRARFTAQLNVRSCGCSGAVDQKTTIGKALLRDALLLCMLIPIVITIIAGRSISPSSSPLIEVVALVCVLAGGVCSQVRSLIFAPQTNRIMVAQNRREVFSVSMLKSNRRSFLKRSAQFGVATILGVGFLWDRASSVLASTPNAYIGPCPNNESCDCGPGGTGGWSGDCEDSYNCVGHEGQYVPIIRFCTVYCCGSGQACEYYRYQAGTHYCPEPGC